VTHLSMQTSVTSPLYAIVRSFSSVICSAFLCTLRWFLYETAHTRHPCYTVDNICAYLSWYQEGNNLGC